MAKLAAVVFSYCPADPRVRRESEALAEEGLDVDVICLKGPGQGWSERVRGVRYIRLPITRKRGGKLRYAWEYFAFTVMAFFVVAGLHLRHWYSAVHVHNMPDVLVFSALVPRLLGSKVILDLHDPMPEVFMTKYDLDADHALIRVLRFFERLSIAFSSVVLTPNIGFRDLFIARGCPEDKIHVIMNTPQESVFGGRAGGAVASGAQPVRRTSDGDGQASFTIMFHGTIVERHGLSTALEALSRLKDTAPPIRFDIYGEGDYTQEFLALVRKLELDDVVTYHGFVTLETIAEAIETVDLGLIPNLRSTFTEINLPTRIFEYLCKGKPVIVPRTKGILDYFGDDDILFFEPGDAESLADAIFKAQSDSELRGRVLERGMRVYAKHSWRLESEKLVGIIDDLIGRDPREPSFT